MPVRLIDRSRGPIALLLVVIAVAQAAAAAVAAQTITAALRSPPEQVVWPAAVLGGLALLSGAATVCERWIGERFAQSYVQAVRASLFEAAILSARGASEARWLTPFVSDLAALRNWAAQGPIRLATSAAASLAGLAWFVVSTPHWAMAAVPIVGGLVLMVGLCALLRRAIADQRVARGGLTRFMMRRIRAEVSGTVEAGRHGRRGLAERSGRLANLAVRRARIAGVIEAAAGASALIASLCLLLVAAGEASLRTAELAGSLTLFAFIAARQLEVSRALHAHVAGEVARSRVARIAAGSVIDAD